jgi:hypothetical protein
MIVGQARWPVGHTGGMHGRCARAKLVSTHLFYHRRNYIPHQGAPPRRAARQAPRSVGKRKGLCFTVAFYVILS